LPSLTANPKAGLLIKFHVAFTGILMRVNEKSKHLLERRAASTPTAIPRTDRPLPIWVRAPIRGPEYYTGFSRSKLYELAHRGKIQSISIREGRQQKGTRLFELKSILAFIDSRVAAQKAAEGNGVKDAQ
jgi:hypothetical protein